MFVGQAGCVWDRGWAFALDDKLRRRCSWYGGPGFRGLVVGISEHGVGHGTEGGGEGDVDGELVAGSADYLGCVVADVLNRLQGAAFRVEGLPGCDGEVREVIACAEEGDQKGSGEAVCYLVGVDVPVRLTN